mmetsp:Transcript_53443/g.134314  ORF Transcript_53443/g.134314 Transcript_53443/m.134314 type:complete len:211 (+) Transcript_53443:1832-2464(+)
MVRCGTNSSSASFSSSPTGVAAAASSPASEPETNSVSASASSFFCSFCSLCSFCFSCFLARARARASSSRTVKRRSSSVSTDVRASASGVCLHASTLSRTLILRRTSGRLLRCSSLRRSCEWVSTDRPPDVDRAPMTLRRADVSPTLLPGVAETGATSPSARLRACSTMSSTTFRPERRSARLARVYSVASAAMTNGCGGSMLLREFRTF